MAINVTVAEGTTLDTSTENQVLSITFSSTAAITYAANSNVYYSALLTDSTPENAITRPVMFSVPYTTAGTITAGATKSFNFENTTNLVPTITASEGAIYYKPGS